VRRVDVAGVEAPATADVAQVDAAFLLRVADREPLQCGPDPRDGLAERERERLVLGGGVDDEQESLQGSIETDVVEQLVEIGAHGGWITHLYQVGAGRTPPIVR